MHVRAHTHVYINIYYTAQQLLRNSNFVQNCVLLSRAITENTTVEDIRCMAKSLLCIKGRAPTRFTSLKLQVVTFEGEAPLSVSEDRAVIFSDGRY